MSGSFVIALEDGTMQVLSRHTQEPQYIVGDIFAQARRGAGLQWCVTMEGLEKLDRLLNSISVTVKQLRNLKRMSLEELADRSGVDAAVISDLESGSGSCPVEDLIRIVEALDASIVDVFSEAELAVDGNGDGDGSQKM